MNRWYFATISLAFTATIFADNEASSAKEGCELKPVLIENFDTASFASTNLGTARWTSHTPWNGDFGQARFLDPGPNGPFKVNDGILSITAMKDREGLWTSGLLAAADASGKGSGTRYGYFEARMKMPPGAGTWPAFWLAALKPASVKDGNVEIDVIEYYGQFTSSYQSVVHVWYEDKTKSRARNQRVDFPSGLLISDFHTFGVDVSPQSIVFFLDGKPVWSQPTPPELDGPLYPIVNLALGGGWPIDQTPNPSILLVDYIHVYGRGAGPVDGCPAGPPDKLR